jgi:preprotein translocase subunit SecF
MRLINFQNLDFMRWRRQAIILSTVVNLIGITSFFVQGLNFGLDFTGGTVVEVGYEDPVDLAQIRAALTKGGFEAGSVQNFGSARDVIIRLPPEQEQSSAELSDRVFNALSKSYAGKVELRRVEFVGPQVGQELAEDGGLAVLYALIGILIYVWLRFEWRFSVGAIIATIHDTLVTVAVFSLFRIEFDLSVLAAVLAVIGYSLNDTIVIFDRIRENFRKVRKGSVLDVVNRSINETMSRTIITSGTTLVVVIALFLFGGQVIHGFALALIIGVLTGTYSSIYVATAAAVMLGVSRADLMPVKKEGERVDALPSSRDLR